MTTGTRTRGRRPNTEQEIENRVAKSADTRTVRRYLEALEGGYDQVIDPAPIRARLEQIDSDLDEASAVRRVRLHQERIDLAEQLVVAETDWGFSDLKAAAIEVMGRWAAAKGISYRALRDAGVPAATLRAAGISQQRTRR